MKATGTKTAITAAEAAKTQLESLKGLLAQHRGKCPAYVHLVLPNQSETVLSLPEELRVMPSAELMESVQKMFGQNRAWFPSQ